MTHTLILYNSRVTINTGTCTIPCFTPHVRTNHSIQQTPCRPPANPPPAQAVPGPTHSSPSSTAPAPMPPPAFGDVPPCFSQRRLGRLCLPARSVHRSTLLRHQDLKLRNSLLHGRADPRSSRFRGRRPRGLRGRAFLRCTRPVPCMSQLSFSCL